MTSATGQPLQGCRVLVVEDEYLVAMDIADALVALGAVVVGPAPTPGKAMALLGTERVTLAVLDINLRGEFVYPVADALHERGVPYVFATGYDGARVLPKRHAHVPLWNKPYNADALAASLPQIVLGGWDGGP